MKGGAHGGEGKREKKLREIKSQAVREHEVGNGSDARLLEERENEN